MFHATGANRRYVLDASAFSGPIVPGSTQKGKEAWDSRRLSLSVPTFFAFWYTQVHPISCHPAAAAKHSYSVNGPLKFGPLVTTTESQDSVMVTGSRCTRLTAKTANPVPPFCGPCIQILRRTCPIVVRARCARLGLAWDIFLPPVVGPVTCTHLRKSEFFLGILNRLSSDSASHRQ